MFDPTYIWFNYFWASDKSNGPEAIQQIVLTGLAVAALWPVARKILRNEMKRAHQDITGVEHELERVFPDVRSWFRKVVRRVR